MKSFSLLALGAVTLFIANGCSKPSANNNTEPQNSSPRIEAPKPSLEPIKLSFLMTNDIHGHFENGISYLGTLVQNLRELPEYKNNKAALFVLDAGDQFQGTLLSNYNEGEAIFKTFNEIGYDAIVPGNHDYDFGPLGWLFDQVRPDHPEDHKRAVIENLAAMAKFPLLSANTYFKDSIKIKNSSSTVSLDDSCRPTKESLKDALDFESATRPAFLKPYQIHERAGVRVALVGLDNHATSTTTTYDNVSDLCFRDEIETYLEIRKSLEGLADVFIIITHNGNSSNSFDASEMAREINKAYPNGVHLIAAGHTHFTHDTIAGGIHVIQDGTGGKSYGRADLYFDPVTKEVNTSLTQSKAGIKIDPNTCDRRKHAFVCDQISLPIASHVGIDEIIKKATDEVAPLAKKKIATAIEKVEVNRVNENALGNVLADALRKSTGTQIALMNTGGIRTDLLPGEVLYEDLFEVSPFQNMAVVMNQVPWKTLKKALLAAAQTCGRYGTLVQSGLKIEYTRTCLPNYDVDFKGALIGVSLLDGTVLLDTENKIEVPENTLFSITTLDFISAGGSGYGMFKGSKVDSVAGIARELIISSLEKDQPVLNNKIDQRFFNRPNPISPTNNGSQK